MNIAIISGASSGMGYAFAKQLDDLQLDEIWVIARREDRLQQLSSQMCTPVRIFAFDLAQDATFVIFKTYLEQECPAIKYLINAAGVGIFGNYTMELEAVSQMIDINIKALVKLSYVCIPFMPKGSHILQVCSSSSFFPLENFNVYASTKAFVSHFSQALAKEIKPLGIKVTILCPGWVKTEFFAHADTKSPYAPICTRPLYKKERVVEQAMQDMHKGKRMSIPGIFTKCHYVASKIIPNKVLMQIWHCLQKRPL